MFSENKKRIRFVVGGFNSPVLGNVWVDRVAVLPKKTAQRFIDLGHAEEIDEEGNVIQAAAPHFAEPETVTGTDESSVKIVNSGEDAAEKADDDADAAAGDEGTEDQEGEDDENAGEDDGAGKAADEGEPAKAPESKVVSGEGHSPKKRASKAKKKK